MTLVEKVARAKRGDDQAFADLVMSRQEKLYRIAYSYVDNREDALDVVSETIYQAYVSLQKLRQDEYFYTWLTRILINRAINCSKRRRTGERDSRDIPLDTAPTNRESLLDLYAAIGRLPREQKTVVILKYQSDLTLEEVADVMQVPLGTVKTYLHRALKELRLELKEDDQ
ncbi:MAG: sigma-70 family RNA polymerase sigma factor [Firmicutes bacterium]|nr:sigma-70 family RNA polymerase sigma factor [Dethiobacter sp.]MBS3889810.1 sigma-70 family RNA polymerase sigma factor [Bacillota bacterium]MBS4054319.1 sigma-70 family RNA polymerase sigma factor [Thermaerobacter sp.]MBS4055262.1 sigma-70 family RNA polymerase sigma factor [Thermaerobacter sp.]